MEVHIQHKQLIYSLGYGNIIKITPLCIIQVDSPKYSNILFPEEWRLQQYNVRCHMSAYTKTTIKQQKSRQIKLRKQLKPEVGNVLERSI